ncbi:MAG: hypothetical protein LBN12_04270, partial [Clostridiales Family XIII bacterium]|nr:hypothetical protein [Clostridiales Family XIII bacterium]
MVDGPVILDKKEETEPVIITEQTEQTLQQQLNSLQSWDTQEGQTLEQRREVEQERIVTRQKANLLLLQNAQQQLGEAPPVEQVAGGGPPVQAVPAKQTYKQKREEKRRDKEARKHCPVGD